MKALRKRITEYIIRTAEFRNVSVKPDGFPIATNKNGGFVTAFNAFFFKRDSFNGSIAVNAHEGTACNFGKAAALMPLIDAEPVTEADTLKFRRCRRPPVGRAENRVLPLGSSGGFLVESLTGETKVTCY